MDWISYPKNKPENDGNYLIGLKEPSGEKDFYCHTFIARYDSISDRWYQFDPISKKEYTAPISIKIIAWMKMPPPFLG